MNTSTSVNVNQSPNNLSNLNMSQTNSNTLLSSNMSPNQINSNNNNNNINAINKTDYSNTFLSDNKRIRNMFSIGQIRILGNFFDLF